VTYEIHIHPKARKELAGLPRKVQRRLDKKIQQLARGPRGQNARPLGAGGGDMWRLRSGDYRVIYQIQDERLVVLVVKVAHRKDVYRGL